MNFKSVCKKFKEKNGLGAIENLNDIISFFTKLSEKILANDPSAIIIADYLHRNIAALLVRKRKSSAREFEDFFGLAMDGIVTDSEIRQNRAPIDVHEVSEIICSYMASNRREKGDIKFPSSYEISLKTSVPNNKEINMGSFAREALFEDFLQPEEYGGERRGGLGSKPQILKLFKKIEEKGKWEEFAKRFELMVKNIYVDDIVFAMKGGDYLTIYCIERDKIRKCLIDAVTERPEKSITILNRYEGNSLRIERDQIINLGKKIKMDFSAIKDSPAMKVLRISREMEEDVFKSLVEGKMSELQEDILEKVEKILELAGNS